MAFVNTFYEADSGDIFNIRLSTAISVLAGAAPAGPASNPSFVKVTKNNREFGIRPRAAIYAQTINAGTRNLKVYIRIPKLTQTAYAASPATVQYKGEDYSLVSRQPEDY